VKIKEGKKVKGTSDSPCRKHEVELIVWQQSPAKIRGLLNRRRRGERRRKRGRPRKEVTRLPGVSGISNCRGVGSLNTHQNARREPDCGADRAL
jgi:hypothetical protein